MRITLILLFFTCFAYGQTPEVVAASWLQANQQSDPVDGIPNCVASWREDDLTAGVTTDWTDRINSFVAVAKGGITASSDGSGGVQFDYDGIDDAHNVDSNPLQLNFLPQVDEYTVVVKYGSVVPQAIIRTVAYTNGSDTGNYQYGLRRENASTYRTYVGGSLANNSLTDQNLVNDIFIMTVSTTTINLYQNNVLINSPAIAGSTSNPACTLSFMAVTNGTEFFSQGTIRDVVIYSRVINATERQTIQDNL